jgi:hypothetical protein
MLFYTSIVIRKANKINPINQFGYSTAKARPYLRSAKSLIKFPDSRDALSHQKDPQEMIDIMVEVIPSDHHL